MSHDGASIDAAAAVLGDRARRDEPLGSLTTYRVGGRAALFVTVDDEDDLVAVARARASSGVPVLVVGRGSNLLVADAGFAGLAVAIGDGLAGFDADRSESSVHAGGGLALPVLARRSVAAGLSGLEWAVGVPGTIGGGVRMNAGGHGSDMAAVVASARIFDLDVGTATTWTADALAFGFRSSAITAERVVVSADFALAAGDRREGERELAEIVRWRRENQPGGQNAGSVFVNPRPESAGRLVDELGLKGHRIGTAEVSTKHGNFVQADDGGSADDVMRLIDHVRRRISEVYGIDLETEVRLVGFAEEARP